MVKAELMFQYHTDQNMESVSFEVLNLTPDAIGNYSNKFIGGEAHQLQWQLESYHKDPDYNKERALSHLITDCDAIY